ncbi:MAG: SDR family oxidoreductase [Planctomycetes bacterium]|nr:SDR family oxidoreductase [Planctomycetota bacterium]
MSAPNFRHVVVTGANRGLGLAFTRHYLQQGSHVLASARDLDAADDLTALAASHRGHATLERLDVADPASVEAFAGCLPFEEIDLLINNAGVYGGEEPRISDVDPEQLLVTLQVNAVGPLHVTKLLWPRLARNARVVHVTSLMGSISDDTSGGRYGYRMSKAALNMMVRNLGHEAAERGVVTFAIHPGWVRTDMGGPSAPLSIDESIASMVETIAQVGPERNGAFVDRDGEPLPW